MPRGEYDDDAYCQGIDRMREVVHFFMEEAGCNHDDIRNELENALENDVE